MFQNSHHIRKQKTKKNKKQWDVPKNVLIETNAHTTNKPKVNMSIQPTDHSVKLKDLNCVKKPQQKCYNAGFISACLWLCDVCACVRANDQQREQNIEKKNARKNQAILNKVSTWSNANIVNGKAFSNWHHHTRTLFAATLFEWEKVNK